MGHAVLLFGNLVGEIVLREIIVSDLT